MATSATSSPASVPSVSNSTAHQVLRVLHYAYPLTILIFFLVAFTWEGMRDSKRRKEILSQLDSSAGNGGGGNSGGQYTGPGGKKLPARKLNTSNMPRRDSIRYMSGTGKVTFEWLCVAVSITFLANSANVIIHALAERDHGWWCGKAYVFYVIGAFFVFSLLIISLLDNKAPASGAHTATWTLALALELVLLGASLALYTNAHRQRSVGGTPEDDQITDWEFIEIFIDVVRVFTLTLMIALWLVLRLVKGVKQRRVKAESDQGNADDENTGLLSAPQAENGGFPGPDGELVATNGEAPAGNMQGSIINGAPRPQSNGYGTTAKPPLSSHGNGAAHGHGHAMPSGWERPTTVPSRSWWEYINGYSVLFPYLWPSKNRRLQFTCIICLIILIAQRGLNALVPQQVGIITDLLAQDQDGHGPAKMPWKAISIFFILRLLQGNNGVLGATRAVLWIPVSQYSYRELSTAAFEHVHGLSLDFHLGKKTGEVISALGKGQAINTFLESVTFTVLPMFFDLIVAIIFFLVKFDSYYALVISIVTFWYVYVTIRMAAWRADIRREMVNADREEDAIKNDSMISYEAVKYFNAERWEFKRYRDAVNKYLSAEYRVQISLNQMNVAQNMIFMLGLLTTCFIVAYQITTGQRGVGHFTTLLMYMAQLQQPLNFFGTFYRLIQSSMINSERMLELFKERPTVIDSPTAKPLVHCDGSLTFKDVHFAYDQRKPALNGLSFHCREGTTTALVGESGGGKSTVFRLLFRFYDQDAGSIQVDDTDVQDVTIDSLRRQIGVVPQDTVLFNESIMYNVRYANQAATDEQVYEACRAASIHDRILSFPDGYNTRVGERGLRLSGGEKQRVAIARTILKDPKIIMLDEATAALDTETEQHIQEAFTALGHGRTMLVIAHRLSTITLADQIVVLHEGRAAEVGTHDELLERRGRYALMWRKQVRAQRAAEEAKALKDRAERLRREAGENSASQSDDEGATRGESSEGPADAGAGTGNGSATAIGDKAGILTPRGRHAKDDSRGSALFDGTTEHGVLEHGVGGSKS